MLSFKGIDNASYYRLMPDDPRYYMDFTGTGNTLNVVHPSVLRLIMDSLRYWVTECHVDGFRFDLASALARELYDVDRLSALLRRHPPGPGALAGEAHRRAVGRRPRRLPGRQLPGALDRVERHLPRRGARLLARPRRAWRRSPRGSPARATSTRTTAASRPRRSTSSPPTTASRSPTSSPTTTSTTRPTSRTTATAPTTTARGTAAPKGPTDDPEIIALRERQQRNLLATLLLSQGVPMLLAGDEIGRTQGGNNNAWCQDNEISWLDWELDDAERGAARVHPPPDRAAPRAPGVPPPRSSTGDGSASGLPDAWWFRPDGRRMTAADWQNPGAPALGVFLNGRGIASATRTASRSSTTRSCCCQRAPRGRHVRAAAAPLRPALAARALDGLPAGRR